MLSKIGKLINFRPSYGILEGPIFKFSPIGDCPRGGILPPLGPNPPSCINTRPPTPPPRAKQTSFQKKHIILYFGGRGGGVGCASPPYIVRLGSTIF
jgi:hypothetical protein